MGNQIYKDLQEWLNDPALVALAVMTSLILGVLWAWHVDKRNSFRLEQTVVDSVTGKVAIEKVGYMTVLMFSIWGFVVMILRNQMTEWYFGLLLATFVLGRFGSSWLSVKKDIQMSEKKEE